MDSILPERLLALVRPAFDLVLRRIQSLKRCAQACGCKIMTPRYACNLAPGCISSEPTFAGLRKKQKTRKQGVQKKEVRGFLWQSLTSLEMQPGAKLQAYLGVIILQPHACTQRFRKRALKRELELSTVGDSASHCGQRGQPDLRHGAACTPSR